ncbi:hypothetical protein ScPMuIL_017984 [Solemya velum]
MVRLQCVFFSSLLLVLPGLNGQDTRYVRTNSDVKLSCPAPSGVAGVSWNYEYLDGISPDYPAIASRDNKYSQFEHSDRILLTYDPDNAVYTITIQAFDGTTDQGRYQCRWPAADGAHTFIVKLAYTKYVKTNDDVILKCPAPPGVDYVAWGYSYLSGSGRSHIASSKTKYKQFEHILLEYDTDNGVYTITIQAFDGTTDQGRYQCWWNDGRHTFIVELAYGPTSVVIHGNNHMLAGKEESLTCGASAAKPGINFQWSKDGIRIEGEEKYMLTLTPVYTDNGASITCVVTNIEYSDLTASDTITLNVQSSPSGDQADDSGSVNVWIGVAFAVVVTVLVILFVIVVVLWLRGIKPPCLRKSKETTNVYQNQAFANVATNNDSMYQDLGPTENPAIHYEELSQSVTVP